MNINLSFIITRRDNYYQSAMNGWLLGNYRPIAKLSDRAFKLHENEAYCVKTNHSTILLCVEK